jgi:DNA adenine methylase
MKKPQKTQTSCQNDKILSKGLIKSPLRYPGGKSRLIKYLVPFFPKHFDEYREPMVGGGSVFFYVKNHNLAKHYWINDIDDNLINFWGCCADGWLNSKMLKALDLYEKSSLELKKIKFNLIKQSSRNILLPAADYYFLNRCSFSGVGTMGGFSKAAAQYRFTWPQISKLEYLPEFLEGVKITQGDYLPCLETTLDQYTDYHCFMFIDPPYDGITSLYPNSDFNHDQLATYLRYTRHKWMLTYNDTPKIRELYKWANITSFKATYGENRKGQAKQATELIIRNYE